jgi:enoyl-CoA hydratase/carnithine racemase
MSEDVLRTSIENNVAQLTFNRPEKRNAFDSRLFKGLAEALTRARDDDEVNVVLLAGEGGNFSSGMDLAAPFDEGSTPYDMCVEAVVSFDKPLIAAVDGIAIGGGATIPLHSDVVYVGESLRMRLPFVNLGLVPEFASSYMLQANIGARRAAELMYTAEWIDAARAYELGIATRVYPDAELHARALEKANEIAKWPLNSLRATKRCIKATQRANIELALRVEAEAMAQQAGSAENIEAVTAFLQKREPDFKGSMKK